MRSCDGWREVGLSAQGTGMDYRVLKNRRCSLDHSSGEVALRAPIQIDAGCGDVSAEADQESRKASASALVLPFPISHSTMNSLVSRSSGSLSPKRA